MKKGVETGVPGENSRQGASEYATHKSPKTLAPTKTQTHAWSLVVRAC